jgi:hypothetical protein
MLISRIPIVELDQCGDDIACGLPPHCCEVATLNVAETIGEGSNTEGMGLMAAADQRKVRPRSRGTAPPGSVSFSRAPHPSRRSVARVACISILKPALVRRVCPSGIGLDVPPNPSATQQYSAHGP